MPYCSPQRYIGNRGNALREATLTPSTVLPVEGQVQEIPVGRLGTGAAVLSGPYTGAEAATYDVEIIDTIADDPFVTAVVDSGVGSGTLTDVAAFGVAQTYTVELGNDGIPQLAAGVDFEGVRIVARTTGAGGNVLSIDIDQSGLTFTAQAFSLLDDLQAGAGGPNSGVEGAAFDWDTKVLSADNIIPADAHRVSFGEDRTNIYLAYKRYLDGEWSYHFVPAIKRTVPAGTIVNFVTGGRLVTVNNGDSPAPEDFAGIITVFDLLNAIKTQSALLDVSGVVAYDRSPTGQASRELLLRTDAHCELSTGSGSEFATGFVDTFANANAATELVTATCVAVSAADHPLARVGAERWNLKGSVSGALGVIVTGEPFTDPAGKFGLTIPRKLPEAYEVQVGRFTLDSIHYVTRANNLKPPICPVALTLGSEAVDQTITLTWTERPTDECACSNMQIPRLSAFCLGLFDTEGGSTVGYQADTITKLTALYSWYATTAAARSTFDAATYAGFVLGLEEPALSAPNSVNYTEATLPYTQPPGAKSLTEIVQDYEAAIARIDPLEAGALRTAGMSAWDDAVTELEADIDAAGARLQSVPAVRYATLLDVALISAGISPLGGADASIIESGDGCWRDLGGDYWTMVGSDKGGYAPVFNNAPFYSCRLSADGKKYFSTKEFGGQINIACPEKLVYGDEIVLVIGGSARGATYTLGDVLTVPIVAGQDLQLAGGQDGNRILDFYVSGSVDGAFPNYVFDQDAPAPYTLTGELEFLYAPGGIPNRKGDRWTFATEGGHYRWRKNGGAWNLDSPPAAISITPAAFDSGLLLAFVPGAAPSFEVGDTFSFRALQPWAVSNVQTPTKSMWRWNEATPTLVADAGAAPVPITGAVIARHTIPSGATITLEGGDVAGVYLWTETLTWREGVIAAEFETPRAARYTRWSLTGATGGGIGWAWAGEMFATVLHGEISLVDEYKLESGTEGLDEGGRYFAQTKSGDLTFQNESLTQADADGLAALVQWAKTHHDEPLAIIPNIERPDEAYMVRAAVDRFTWQEASGNNATPGLRDRRYTIDIPLTGVWGR